MIPKILCDTDFFIALLIEEDTNHEKAISILQTYNQSIFSYSNLTVYELMTVLSRKLPQTLAIQALTIFETTFDDRFDFDLDLEVDIMRFYKQSVQKNMSFFDIACLIQAQKYQIPIASFDSFYPKELLVKASAIV
jgi:predicted nucleic acid-binding protein